MGYVAGCLLAAAMMVAAVAATQCVDLNGNDVDWWVAYKFPKLPGNSNSDYVAGTGYIYSDSNSLGQGWQVMENGIDSTSSNAVYNTLQQIYSAGDDTAYIMYDDEDPSNVNHETFGHTKGDLCWDSNSGFWLVHSVPRWPPVASSGYEYPANECDFGQTFLCLSFDTDTFDTIGSLMMHNKPYVYDSNLPSWAKSRLPNMASVISKSWVTSASSEYDPLTTLEGTTFHAFGKTGAWGKELYSDLVAPTLASGLYVETWMNGPADNNVPSYCTPQYDYDTWNIQSLSFTAGDVNFSNHKDHAKWATGMAGPWTCIGDINRQFSQANRGGGTVCLENEDLFGMFNSTISTVQNCS